MTFYVFFSKISGQNWYSTCFEDIRSEFREDQTLRWSIHSSVPMYVIYLELHHTIHLLTISKHISTRNVNISTVYSQVYVPYCIFKLLQNKQTFINLNVDISYPFTGSNAIVLGLSSPSWMSTYLSEPSKRDTSIVSVPASIQ